MALGLASLLLFLLPWWQAWRLSRTLQKDFAAAFPAASLTAAKPSFNPLRILTKIPTRKVPFEIFVYDKDNGLTLDFYPAAAPGNRPCIVVIHGGSWAGGDSQQLPELNSEMARWGYHVASITYRQAPKSHYPAPLEDVHTAMNYLRGHAGELSLDPDRFVLLKLIH